MKTFDFHAERELLLANLNYLKQLSPKILTLRMKWDEMVNTHFEDRSKIVRASDFIWTPRNLKDEHTTIHEIANLKPKVLLCLTETQKQWWLIYRLFASSAEYNPVPARNIRFLVIHESEKQLCDEIPGTILGVGAIGSDANTILCRDKYIGWTRENKWKQKKLRNIAIGSTIVPTHPFGTNFLGGKLIAALTTSKSIREQWRTQYGDVLAGLTTTALNGSYSMYSSLKWWKSLGTTKGKVAIRPDSNIWSKWRAYARQVEPEKFSEAEEDRHTQMTALIFKTANIPLSDYNHGHERGVLFASVYENTKEFLCNRISEGELKIKPLFERDVEAILDWWIPKAIARYQMLKAEGRLNSNTLFYKEGYRMDWETFSKVWLNRM
jgi:Druantia protein DruA